jgi:hypothetical protein
MQFLSKDAVSPPRDERLCVPVEPFGAIEEQAVLLKSGGWKKSVGPSVSAAADCVQIIV